MKKKLLIKAVSLASAVIMGCMCFAGCGQQSTETASSDGPLTLDAIKAKGKLTVATEAAYEPFEYLDGDKIVGYNADLFAKICED